VTIQSYAEKAFIVYDVKTNTTTNLAPIPKPRANYGMTLISSNEILVCGGFSSIITGIVADCDLYRVDFKFESVPDFKKFDENFIFKSQ
jgi:hypothetical protein